MDKKVIEPSQISSKRFYVYTLSDPDSDTPFYIGKGSGDRIRHHEKQAALSDKLSPRYAKNKLKCETICMIWAKGKEVKREIVFETDDDDEAYSYEKQLIGLYKDKGLTNLSSGQNKGRNRNSNKSLKDFMPWQSKDRDKSKDINTIPQDEEIDEPLPTDLDRTPDRIMSFPPLPMPPITVDASPVYEFINSIQAFIASRFDHNKYDIGAQWVGEIMAKVPPELQASLTLFPPKCSQGLFKLAYDCPTPKDIPAFLAYLATIDPWELRLHLLGYYSRAR